MQLHRKKVNKKLHFQMCKYKNQEVKVCHSSESYSKADISPVLHVKATVTEYSIPCNSKNCPSNGGNFKSYKSDTAQLTRNIKYSDNRYVTGDWMRIFLIYLKYGVKELSSQPLL